MKPRLLALLTAASLLAPTAFARLGETEAEVQARYGAAEGLNSNGAALPAKRQKFHFKGFTIVVSFVDGKSVCELVFKTEDTN